jgi:hypothetical protein
MSATSIDVGTVLRRHDRTMSVVDLVEDEPARWTLLEYVLAGSAAVEAAMAHARRPCRPRGGRRRVFDKRQRAGVEAIARGPVIEPILERPERRPSKRKQLGGRSSPKSPSGRGSPMWSPLASRGSRSRPRLGARAKSPESTPE